MMRRYLAAFRGQLDVAVPNQTSTAFTPWPRPSSPSTGAQPGAVKRARVRARSALFALGELRSARLSEERREPRVFRAASDRGVLSDVQGCTNPGPRGMRALGQGLWFLFFAQAKKRNPPAVREPQLALTSSAKPIQNIAPLGQQSAQFRCRQIAPVTDL